MQLAEYTAYLKNFYTQKMEQRLSGVSEELSYPSEIRQSCTLLIYIFLLLDLRDYFSVTLLYIFWKNKLLTITFYA
jgi:hypothetical protein